MPISSIPGYSASLTSTAVGPDRSAAMGALPAATIWIGPRSRASKTSGFAKKGRLKVDQMVRSSWVYRQLFRFRVGIEGCISMLKRVFGVGRCTWKGWRHFQQYAYLSVTSVNLLVLARLLL